MKALVTGATGFVGAAVARALSAAGWQVRVLARSGSNRSNLQSPAWEVVEGDLADLQSLERALEGCTGAARTGMSVVIVNPSTPVGPGDIKPTPTGQLVLDAASGRMPAYVDTGLNIVHVDDVAAGHLLAFQRGRAGERYILGGEDMTLQTILGQIARLVGRAPPRIRLPYAAVLPVAYLAEGFAKISGRSGRVTLEGVRMSRKRMFFSSAKAVSELGYRWRPPLQAFEDALRWYRERGLLS